MNKLTLSALALLMTLGLAACSQDDNEGVDLEEAGDNDVLHKVLKDLTAKGQPATERDIRAKMDELLAVAVAQVKAGT